VDYLNFNQQTPLLLSVKRTTLRCKHTFKYIKGQLRLRSSIIMYLPNTLHGITTQHKLNVHFPVNLTSHKNELTESKISNSDKLPVEEHES